VRLAQEELAAEVLCFDASRNKGQASFIHSRLESARPKVFGLFKFPEHLRTVLSTVLRGPRTGLDVVISFVPFKLHVLQPMICGTYRCSALEEAAGRFPAP